MTELLDRSPPWARELVAWLLRPDVLVALGVGSVVLFLLGIVGVPWFLTRVPADFFSLREQRHLGIETGSRARWIAVLRALRNLVGVFLLAAGVVMLFMPGQGLLTMLVGLTLVDFPGKRRLQRRVLAVPRIHETINALRRRAGREPLVLTGADDEGDHRHA